MKDPCDICLVRVTCWQECEEKENHARLIADAEKYFTGNRSAMQTYNKQYRKVRNIAVKHNTYRNNIWRRQRTMSQDN